MQKKGLSDSIDWILGIGMFLLALGFILVLFKPGIISLHSSSTLLDIVETNFFKDVKWEINKVPIFLEPVKYCVPQPGLGCIEQELETKENGAIIFLGGTVGDALSVSSVQEQERNKLEKINALQHRNIETFYVPYDPSDGGLNSQFAANEISSQDDYPEIRAVLETFLDSRNNVAGDKFPMLTKDNPNSIKFYSATGNELYISGKLLKDTTTNLGIKTKDYIIYSTDRGILNLGGNFFSFTLDKTDEIRVVVACNIPNYLGGFDVQSNQKKEGNAYCRARYEIGVAEKLKGMSLVNLTNLKNGNLDEIKQRWGFPTDRNFRVVISGKDLDIDSANPNGKSFNEGEDVDKLGLVFPQISRPPLNVNIYARRFNDFILNDDGVLVPVTVTMQVW